jgi:N-acetylneuraminate lyase
VQDINKLKGIVIAFYAPFDESGEIDCGGALRQAEFYRSVGVKSLYLNGSSGAGFLLSLQERKKLTEAVAKEFGSEMSIIVHVGAASTRDSVELARHAEQCGADALAAVPSVYYRLNEDSIEHHWNSIIDSTDLPFIIYNIPQLTGYDLTLRLLGKMVKNKKVVGVKNSSVNVGQIEQFKKAGGKDFIVFSGADDQYLAGRVMGAEAGIGGTYGMMPELFLRLEELIAGGDIGAAYTLQSGINDIICEAVSFNNVYIVGKEILRLRGVDIGSVRPPMLPIGKHEMPRIEALYGKIKKLAGEVRR